jgi:hypothetical protein
MSARLPLPGRREREKRDNLFKLMARLERKERAEKRAAAQAAARGVAALLEMQALPEIPVFIPGEK